MSWSDKPGQQCSFLCAERDGNTSEISTPHAGRNLNRGWFTPAGAIE